MDKENKEEEREDKAEEVVYSPEDEQFASQIIYSMANLMSKIDENLANRHLQYISDIMFEMTPVEVLKRLIEHSLDGEGAFKDVIKKKETSVIIQGNKIIH